MADDMYTVTRSTVVAAPADQIFAHLVDFHRWTAWSPWEGLDPQLRRSYSGPESGVGSAYAWSGNRKAGRGSMTMVDAVEPSEVLVDVVFEKPFPSRSQSRFVLRPDGGSTEVVWTMTGAKTLMSRVMGVFVSMDKLIGPDFERGLSRLKSVTESTGN
jgi:Polyketide cyclase / dehydrase and lipid transport